jgi:hypothetical protein
MQECVFSFFRRLPKYESTKLLKTEYCDVKINNNHISADLINFTNSVKFFLLSFFFLRPTPKLITWKLTEISC